ncbi:CMRF35-like molecule 5, partial [Amia ocellicauda]|uniref:CMRF35-like molecule 5 n=1 Tax=Amia ocellicauda TaxID=2972642 RepID=UPI003464DF34
QSTLYSEDYETHTKYWCKGNRQIDCSIVGTTDSPQTRDRTSIRDDRTRREFTITVRDLRAEDEGWYWCGIRRTFIDKLVPVYLSVNSGRSTEFTPTTKTATQPGSTEALDTTTAREDPTVTRAGPTPAPTSRTEEPSPHTVPVVLGVSFGVLLSPCVLTLIITRKMHTLDWYRGDLRDSDGSEQHTAPERQQHLRQHQLLSPAALRGHCAVLHRRALRGSGLHVQEEEHPEMTVTTSCWITVL